MRKEFKQFGLLNIVKKNGGREGGSDLYWKKFKGKLNFFPDKLPQCHMCHMSQPIKRLGDSLG